MPPDGDHRYFTSTAVFLNEIIKLAISLTFALLEHSRSLAPQTPATVLFEQLYNSVFSGDGWKLIIPAALYTLQNTLVYVAVGNLDPIHFQILYQLKVRKVSGLQSHEATICSGLQVRRAWLRQRGFQCRGGCRCRC